MLLSNFDFYSHLLMAAGCKTPSKVQEENCVFHKKSEDLFERRKHQEECKLMLRMVLQVKYLHALEDRHTLHMLCLI